MDYVVFTSVEKELVQYITTVIIIDLVKDRRDFLE